jgi:two-component system chemotaxis response regulator CheB
MRDPTRSARDIVVIGSSAGGIQALRTVLGGIDRAFPGVIAVVQHRSPYHPDSLAHVISNHTGHVLREPRDNEPIAFGTMYLAPRDRHLRFADGTFRLERGPHEHFSRPSVDVLFRSAAEAYGPRVLGVILTGGGHDGGSGLVAIRNAGGGAIVENPNGAFAASMPRNALMLTEPDAVLPVEEIAPRIMAAMRGSVGVRGA